jgi:hypothetical protein
MNYKFNIGDQVIWRGGWGRNAPAPAKIIDLGEKNGEPVYDLDNGHWAYQYQLKTFAEFVGRQVEDQR